jgi:hypothetical protein
MRLSTRGLLAGPWVGALFALLMLGIVSPSAARAGCSSRHGGGTTLGLELLASAAAFPDDPGETPHERPTPCSGAFCSGNPAPPFSAVPASSPSATGQWAIAAFPFTVAGPGSSAYPPIDARLRPVDLAGSVFHPPRPAFGPASRTR